MKKILITGVNSYIGTSFKKWISQYPDKYSVDAISLRDEHWKEKSFFGYDVIFHTAAIVHVKENDTANYFKVNKELTVELAKKAKKEGVKQFIFLSTMGVYGTETGFITKYTKPIPKTTYAQSKYEAEQPLLEINSSDFNVAILRPPIVYGKGCPGNYVRLARLALMLPIFPDIDNKRSMIYIDNLSEFIRIIIDNNQGGIYFPQNKEYVNTTDLVRLIAKAQGKEIKTSKVFNWALAIGLKMSRTLRKVFGSFVYDIGISGSCGTKMNMKKIDYEVVSFEESIVRTEGREQI
ncbi:NAD-dependent epimerase/dehydratase family protein [Bacillus sp. FJAT-49732]|uniref:NAD-dependent epimerase/dehydratase family protein n=1 Tax=Lederbergia citrisecunda TaxID=2833583 RepID=A0A942YME1_9BACI|nr:NAD-dependent epimerase/dehydratase family protein [Lederbergia citrisecunda]MBS4200600.1 NAD-dependent epimerase/dehydratase family protein [Lederbergia citrisecunda]